MSFHSLAIFSLIYLLATATPGPGIAALVARVLSRGSAGIGAFIAGYVIGDLTWFTLAATGMAALARTAHSLFLGVKYAGAAYLLYLAYRMWTTPAEPLSTEEALPDGKRPLQLFMGSLSLTIGNPKAMVFFLALLPTVVDLESMTVVQFLQIALAMILIFSCVLAGYTLAALRARKLFRSPRALRWLNRGTGTAMAGAAVTVAAR